LEHALQSAQALSQQTESTQWPFAQSAFFPQAKPFGNGSATIGIPPSAPEPPLPDPPAPDPPAPDIF
jgi:hypothetical protein